MSSAYLCERCDFQKGNRIDRDYTVDRPLGEGTFGQVFRVTDQSGKRLALKLLKLWIIPPKDRERLMKRFEQEYETGKISSNYLVRSLKRGMVQGNPYIIMEYCPGGDLRGVVEHGKPIDLSKIAKEVLFGLRDLHRNGKVHRDLKPENVLLRQDGSAVLTDFGIAGDQNKRMTEMDIFGKPKQIFGTYPYMPPEQVNPKNKNYTVLPTTDIFSFGAMMYWMLTGRLPFGPLVEDADLMPYLENVEAGRWDKKSLLRAADGEKWIGMIEGCLMPDFKNRLQTTDEVIELLPQTKNKDDVIYRSMDLPTDKPDMQIRNGVMLRIMQGEEYGRIYKLDELLIGGNQIITMGRRNDDVHNKIAIKEDETTYVSRCHCTFELDYGNGRWIIRDGQWRNGLWKFSLNGTYVNSRQVDMNGMPIKPGDIISVGDVKLRVEGY